jgi:protein gp37
MSDKTSIEWTDATWNPVTGCTKVSSGCDHCYAERITERFHGRGSFAEVQLHWDRVQLPMRWRKPRRVFVNSMSDLFHDEVPAEFIASVFATMAVTPNHTYQVLTKRHGRLRSLLNTEKFADDVWALVWQFDGGLAWRKRHWPLRNVWVGVSVEDQKWADIRIPALLETPAAVRWLSCEPLIGPVRLLASLMVGAALEPRGGIGWVVAGGESGPGARPMHPDWPRRILADCRAASVPFLFKQWGAWGPLSPVDDQGRFTWKGAHAVANDGTVYDPADLAWPDGPRWGEAIRAGHDHAHLTNMYCLGKKGAGRELDGRTWDQYPQPVPASAA